MKKIIYTTLAIFAWILPIAAQDASKENTVKEVVDNTTSEAKVDATETDASENKSVEAKETVQPEVDFNKPRFGSKEHRKSLNLGNDKKAVTSGLLLKTCLSLAAVIGIIMIIFSLLKKYNSKFLNTGKDNPIRVCNRAVIDGKNYLTLVRVHEEELLLAVGPNGTNLIARYALIEKEEGDFTSLMENGGNVVPIDEETHVASINLKPIKDHER